MLLPSLALVLAVAEPQTAAAARPADSVLAMLYPRDSATRLVLTADAVHFGFTERGAVRMRRASDSAPAARPRSAHGARFDGATLARRVVDDIARDTRRTFPLASVREVRVDGATLTLCFAPRAPGEAACAKNHFVVDAATADGARSFAEAVERARRGA